ncbi:hypothetical protein LZQ00_16980 [Sphingobacterium sp. SRCM116780]|uniref:hypothetical protein n=1 Tax=Sphingobacterium sp. SRCM116780 TaxID=2907623 RepID=UPI001F20AD3E|nr:hypothetical protein [Sphingobacterium sp. SRCM116780]UIR55943.1 hypothetical protein LZQ00_16980 [Sphingobacterium sp. SRCM116780]
MSRQFLRRATLSVHCRFNPIGDHRNSKGGECSKSGSLLFHITRRDLDIRHIVIKDVKVSHPNFKVSLEQLIMITFPQDSTIAHESSVRFRIRGPLSKIRVLDHHFVLIKGYMTAKSAERITFRLRVPVEPSPEETQALINRDLQDYDPIDGLAGI